MKRVCILLLLTLLTMFSASAGSYAAEAVNVEQYLGMVRNYNHMLLSSAKNLEAAYFQVLSSVGYQRLRAGFNVSGVYSTAQWAAGNKIHSPLGYSITPSLSQVIDISGVHKLSERQSILGYEATRAGFDDAVNSTLAAAEQMYWGVVMARDNVLLQKDVLRQRQENLRVTDEKFKQQLVPKLDVIRATSTVSDAQNMIVNAEATLLNSLAVLRNFVGGADVEPKDSTFYVPALSINVNETLAIENHPDVRQKRILLVQSDVRKQISKKGLAPSLTASANWDMLYGVSTGAGSSETGEANVGLSLNIPISDGNETKYDILNKSSSVLAAGETLLDSEATVILNLSVARNNWEKAKSLEANMKQQVERSNEELKITELMYNEGMGSQLDLITAQTDNQTVRTNYLQAVMGMYTTIADLRKAMGDYAPDINGTWRDAVVQYGKGDKMPETKIAHRQDVKENEKEKVLTINVRGKNVPVDEVIQWLKNDNIPVEYREDVVLDNVK